MKETNNANDSAGRDTACTKLLAARNTDEIIAVMREEDEAAAREKILKTLTPACRKKLQYIENWLRTEVKHCLRRRYELGLQVREIYEDEKKNGGKIYGKNAIAKICKVLSWHEGVIYEVLRFVRAFTSDDLERLCALVLPTGRPLTWGHVTALLVVKDGARREEMLQRTVAEGWTCYQLASEVKALVDRPSNDGRGRPLRVPTGFDTALAQQQQKAEEWERRHTGVWAAPDHALATHAAKLTPDDVTEERLRQARELASQLRRVADQALAQAEQAERVVRDFERILDKRRGCDPRRPRT